MNSPKLKALLIGFRAMVSLVVVEVVMGIGGWVIYSLKSPVCGVVSEWVVYYVDRWGIGLLTR